MSLECLEDVRRLQSGKLADREHRLVHQGPKQLGKLGWAVSKADESVV
jgi:hypothetical protein